MHRRTLIKDFYRLQKNIASFTNDEGRITEFNDELTYIKIELNIRDGYYQGARFGFTMSLHPDTYPTTAPNVTFTTPIYHPNIDDGFNHGAICFNLLDDWTEHNDLQDIVHGLLFLVKNPNFEDPLNPLFSEVCMDDDLMTAMFEKNVRISLEGGYVEWMMFERNSGFAPDPGQQQGEDHCENTSEHDVTTDVTSGVVSDVTTDVTTDVTADVTNDVTTDVRNDVDAAEQIFGEIEDNDLEGISVEAGRCAGTIVAIPSIEISWTGVSNQFAGRCQNKDLLASWLVHLFSVLTARRQESMSTLCNFHPKNYFQKIQWNKR